MTALSTNRLLLQAKARLARAQETLSKAADEPERPGHATRLLDAKADVSYWRRRVQEMVAGG